MKTETVKISVAEYAKYPNHDWGSETREEALVAFEPGIPLGIPVMHRLVLPGGAVRWQVVKQLVLRGN